MPGVSFLQGNAFGTEGGTMTKPAPSKYYILTPYRMYGAVGLLYLVPKVVVFLCGMALGGHPTAGLEITNSMLNLILYLCLMAFYLYQWCKPEHTLRWHGSHALLLIFTGFAYSCYKLMRGAVFVQVLTADSKLNSAYIVVSVIENFVGFFFGLTSVVTSAFLQWNPKPYAFGLCLVYLGMFFGLLFFPLFDHDSFAASIQPLSASFGSWIQLLLRPLGIEFMIDTAVSLVFSHREERQRENNDDSQTDEQLQLQEETEAELRWTCPQYKSEIPFILLACGIFPCTILCVVAVRTSSIANSPVLFPALLITLHLIFTICILIDFVRKCFAKPEPISFGERVENRLGCRKNECCRCECTSRVWCRKDKDGCGKRLNETRINFWLVIISAICNMIFNLLFYDVTTRAAAQNLSSGDLGIPQEELALLGVASLVFAFVVPFYVIYLSYNSSHSRAFCLFAASVQLCYWVLSGGFEGYEMVAMHHAADDGLLLVSESRLDALEVFLMLSIEFHFFVAIEALYHFDPRSQSGAKSS